MTIGIDLSPIQGPHRMRGIGYTLINFINNLPVKERKAHNFVFYVLPEDQSDFGDPLEILNVENLSYEVRTIQARRRISRKLPGRLNMLINFLNALIEIKDLKFGDSRIKDLKGVDTFLQADQSQSIPRKLGMKKVLIIYDIIPYAVEWDYLWSYKTARNIYGFSRKAALRCKARRNLYHYKLKLNIKRADRLLAISELTKQDFLKAFSVKESKIIVTPLGVSEPNVGSHDAIDLHRYEETSWGFLSKGLTLDKSVPYVLFVGGADKRRKLQDLVTAFNQLRAKGVELKLILAGDSMKAPENIATEEIQYALRTSSYLDDIIFMGFIDDTTRDWLYKNALTYVFPSRYEGFGLPVLEAMIHNCPVISYRNQATEEVAADAPLYVDDATGIEKALSKLLNSSNKELQAIKDKGLAQAGKYNWSKTSESMLEIITN